MQNIFGYTFEQIQRAQQGGRLNNAVDTTKEASPDGDLRADQLLLAKHGLDGLRTLGYMGVVDRLERAGLLVKGAKDPLSTPVTTGPTGDPRLFIKVEYDTLYTGGDYSGVGQTVLIPTILVEALQSVASGEDPVEMAFRKHTHLDSRHIVFFSVDEEFNAAGDTVSDPTSDPLFMRSDTIKANFQSSGSSPGDLQTFVDLLRHECGELFADDQSASAFLSRPNK